MGQFGENNEIRSQWLGELSATKPTTIYRSNALNEISVNNLRDGINNLRHGLVYLQRGPFPSNGIGIFSSLFLLYYLLSWCYGSGTTTTTTLHQVTHRVTTKSSQEKRPVALGGFTEEWRPGVRLFPGNRILSGYALLIRIQLIRSYGKSRGWASLES